MYVYVVHFLNTWASLKSETIINISLSDPLAIVNQSVTIKKLKYSFNGCLIAVKTF